MASAWGQILATRALPAARLVLLLLLYVLDAQDLIGKLRWLGPREAFAFGAVRTQRFSDVPLEWAARRSLVVEPGDALMRSTGWTSLFERCEQLFPVGGARFHTVRATNCELGSLARPYTAPEVVLTASARVDAVAWASCRLLSLERRPPICQEELVTHFFQRYRIEEPRIEPGKLAGVNSEAESELRRVLALIGGSHPLSGVVCAQGFQSSQGVGTFAPVIFVCGSPNVFESAIVGFHAPAFAEVHRSLGWLTVDRISIFGLELVTRQNARTVFVQDVEEDDLVVVEKTTANFSSFGHLYVLIVVADLALFSLNVRSALEACNTFGLRQLLGLKNDANDAATYGSGSWMMLYRSLCRCNAVVVLTLLSGVLSWLLILPHSVVWTWSDASNGKTFALATVIRVWMVVVCCVNIAWDALANVVEHRAYKISNRAFVSVGEILAITLGVVVAERHRVFGIATAKYSLDRQRVVDDDSFVNYTALANSYNDELDGFGSTSPELLRVIFAPFARIIVESMAIVAVVICARYLFHTMKHERIARSKAAVVDAVVVAEDDDLDALLSTPAASEDDDQTSKRYHRVSLEQLIGVPIRASALVRSTLDMEFHSNGQVYILPEVYFDFGVVLKGHFIQTRQCFLQVVRQRLDVRALFPMEPDAKVAAPSTQLYSEPREVQSKISKFVIETDAPSSSREGSQTAASPPSPLRRHSTMDIHSMRRRKSTKEMLMHS